MHCTALAACVSLDETKYWSDKADALAAWAKIYHSDDVERKAKQLKLRAYRRMGEIAAELRPVPKGNAHNGSKPGPRSLLVENGLSPSEADAARRLAKTTTEQFTTLLARPTSPHVACRQIGMKAVPPEMSRCVSAVRSLIGSFDPQEVASAYSDTSDEFRKFISEASEWFDELERFLSKRKK